jgi:hypothetical protein
MILILQTKLDVYLSTTKFPVKSHNLEIVTYLLKLKCPNKFPGIKSEVVCINSICTRMSTDWSKQGCQQICGQATCSNAKDPGTCDLTKQLPGFTGDKEIYLNGTA